MKKLKRFSCFYSHIFYVSTLEQQLIFVSVVKLTNQLMLLVLYHFYKLTCAQYNHESVNAFMCCGVVTPLTLLIISLTMSTKNVPKVKCESKILSSKRFSVR